MKQRVKATKYIIIFILLFIHLPGILVAYGLGVVDRQKYFNSILGCMILTRIGYLSLFGYVYGLFAQLFRYFVHKKLEIKKRADPQASLSVFQKFIVAWTVFLLVLKASNILIIVTWFTYYQLLAPRTQTENLIQTIF
jgi:hypothetical protein